MNKRDKREFSAARRRAEQHGTLDISSFKVPDGTNLLKVKEGPMKLDILGYKVGKGNPWADEGTFYFERTFWVHRGIGPNKGSYVCLAKTAKKTCPVCEHLNKLRKSGDESVDLLKSLSPKERQLFNVYNYAEPDKGVQLLEVSYFNFGARLDSEIKAAEEDENIDYFFAHSKEDGGMTLKVNWKEDSFAGNKFLTADSIKFIPRIREHDEDVLQGVHCLDDLLIVLSYNELKQVFLQTDVDADIIDDEDDKDDDNKTNKETKKHKTTVPVSKVEVEEDEVTRDEEEDMDDEVNTTPVTKDKQEQKTSKKVTVDDLLDDLDNDDVSGEEEESDESKDDEDEEESDTDKVKVGDTVEFTQGEETYVGTVVSITDDVAKVKTNSGKIRMIGVDKLSVVEEDLF